MFCFGEYLLVALAVLVPNWRSLTLAAGCVGTIALLLYPIVPESARWLISQEGKEDKAVELLRSLSVHNGSQMPERHLLLLRSRSSRALSISGDVAADSTDTMLRVSRSVKMVGIAAAAGDQQLGQLRACKSMPVLRHDSSVHPVDASSSSSSSDDSVAEEGSSCRIPTDCEPDAAAAVAAKEDASSIADTAAAAAKPPSLGQLLWQHPSMAAMSLVMLLVWFSNFSSFYVIALGSGGLPGSM
jgi:hypothetical protein